MHFHKDSSLPLILSPCSSLDFPTGRLSGFLCFVPPISKRALSCLALWCLSRKGASTKGLFGKSCVTLTRDRNLVREGELLGTQVCMSSIVALYQTRALDINPRPSKATAMGNKNLYWSRFSIYLFVLWPLQELRYIYSSDVPPSISCLRNRELLNL